MVEDAHVQSSLIDVERRRIAELYGAGKLSDEARRRIERELDLEYARNVHAAESASGDPQSDPANE